MLKKIFLLLTFHIVLLGENKLFYNSKGILLFDISSTEVQLIKQKNITIPKEVNLEEIVLNKKINLIGKIQEKSIKYVEYDMYKKEYNIYYELKFMSEESHLFFDKTLIMVICDENFNYIGIESYPIYEYNGQKNKIIEILETKNGAVAFFRLDNQQDMKTLKYNYDGKELYLIRHKDGSEVFNNEDITEIFRPYIINKKQTFILGIGSLNGSIRDTKLYKYNIKTEKTELIKEFSNTAVFLKTLVENDRKVIYSTLNTYENISDYGNKGRKIFILDLKNLKEKEFRLRDDLFEDFYYSHEVRNTDKELIDKFYKSK